MSERGFVAVDRAIFDHACFSEAPFSEREAWLWLIMEAAWKKRTRRIGHILVDLERGQLAASLRFMAERWRWSKDRVARFLERLGDGDQALIETSTTRGICVITIRHYAGDGRQDDATGPRQPRDRREDVENIEASNTPPVTHVADSVGLARQRRDEREESNNINSPEADASGERRAQRALRGMRFPFDWSPSQDDITFARTLLDAARIPFETDKFRDYWRAASGPPAVKRDWSAAWRNWVRKATEMRGNNGGAYNGPSRSGGFARMRAARIAEQLGLDPSDP